MLNDINDVINVNYTVGFIYLTYGIVKIILGMMLINVPYEYLLQIPIINLLLPNIDDDTLAGSFFEYMLVVFSIYTIFVGLALLDVFPNRFRLFLENKRTEYAVFIIIGALLLIFYSLVLYTNLPISKKTDDESMYNYGFYGYLGSFSFIIMVAVFELMYWMEPSFRSLSFERRALIISGLSIIFIIGTAIVIKYFKIRKENVLKEKRMKMKIKEEK